MGEEEELLRESNPNAAGPERASGGMGVSSEREGHTGPQQHSTDGTKDTSLIEPEGDLPPEQSAGNPEMNTDTAGRKSAYPSADPRAEGEEPEVTDPGFRHTRESST